MSIGLGESSTPDNMRIYAIGDVHGYISLLETLYEHIVDDLKANPVQEHKIIFLGDYIDRGPNSSGCVDYLISLKEKNQQVICLKGNHEDKLERFLQDPIDIAYSFFTYGGVECAESYGVDMAGYQYKDQQTLAIASALKERLPEKHKVFYANLTISVAFGDYFFVHAGVRPGIALTEQTKHQELYEKVIVHGHTPSYPMEIMPNRINVDTHAYHTGVLTCLVLEGTSYRIINAT